MIIKCSQSNATASTRTAYTQIEEKLSEKKIESTLKFARIQLILIFYEKKKNQNIFAWIPIEFAFTHFLYKTQ